MLQQTDSRETLPVQTEDVYPLSPVQEGMVFHDLYAPETGAYCSQYVFTLRGELDAEVLRRAWQRVLERSPGLRSVFLWEGMARPVQAVLRSAELPWQTLDWRDAPREAHPERMRLFLEAERARGFDLLSPPLMRLALVRTEEDAWELAWSHHHLLLDGWSISLVLQDVLACYDALLRGRAPALPRRRPYRDYIAWLLRQDLAAAEAYWRGVLGDFTAPTPLPGERAAGEAGPEHGEAGLLLEAGATAALQGFAKGRRLTLNTLVQGAWALLLARYAGVEEVVFGMVSTGRPPELAGMEQMVGLFINTLPVRVEVEGGARVDAWLQGLQAAQQEARAYEYSPLSQVQRWSGVPAGQALFESIVAFENHPVEEMAGAGERSFVVERWAREGRSHYPLELMVLPGERLSVRVEYERGRVESEAAERLVGQMETLLEAIAADPGRRVSEVPLLRPAERAQVLEGWNATAAEAPQGCVHELFAAQAARTPEAAAVVYEGQGLTYAELEERANRLAHHLVGLEVGPDARVGICLERGVELVVALLAVLKAGGAYVPLDPAYPAERLAYMLADSGACVLLTTERLREVLPAEGARVLCLDGEAGRTPAGGERPAARRPDPGNLAYVIYTSGSTGTPKGAGITHGALANHTRWMQDAFPLEADDRVLQKTPFSFDASVWEFWAPLVAGATLVVAEPGAHREPARLARLLEEERISVVQFVPTLLGALLEEDLSSCRTVRRVFCGGEALPAGLAARCRAALGAEVVNLYGPTEACIDTLHAVVDGTPGTVPIGRPVANTRAYVLDGAGEPVPVGMPGELHLGGAQLGRGYLGRPAQTAGSWVPDPFSGEAGARLYRTGDRVRRRADGALEFLGRMDLQVKVRGFRVEPGEIEAVLTAHPGVREAAVVAWDRPSGEPGDRSLAAYVVPAAGAEGAASELRAYLRERLPAHMVPGVIVSLERLPLTPGGKVDRRALPVPEHEGAASAFLAPRTATEEVLAGIWAEVLGTDRVGVEDSFFELGGHSLLAMQVVSRIRQAFGVEIPVRTIFETPTVAALAGCIDAPRSAGATPPPPLVRVSREGALPLSFAQQRLWLVDRLEPGSAAYNMAGALRLRGALDTAALRASLDALVERHETLRTTFAEGEGGQPVQVIHSPAPVALAEHDLRGLPEVEREAERLAAEEAQRPFDLATGPLLRTALLRLAEDD
ncbi:MAG TPA: amino acid adenylation domain-containing protein, partial [Longimicrobiaceae bacterium]|nr:amino acid adenylation domain-containing protein [Longimicrobiaceae bacterium]